MEPSPIPVTSVKTGVIHEERSFDWEISNFPVVLKHLSMIKSQQFEFYAGGSIGLGSKWQAFLQAVENDGRKWIGIFIGLKERPVVTSEHLCAQFFLTFKNKDGVIKKTMGSSVIDFYDPEVVPPECGFGFPKVVDVTDGLPGYVELHDGSLVINLKFRLFALSKTIQPLKIRLEEFQVKSTAKAREGLTMSMGTLSLGNQVLSNSVKIISNDKVEFWMLKGILSGRSPVFRAMLEADMIEGNAGVVVVEIQDMGSESLKVLLHFMNTGELLPEWTSTGVLVDLTNAAAKFELTDLLNFLDGVLGNVCNLDNVGMLIALASRLSLKTAEKDLMCFLRRIGTNSSESFLQVLNAVLASQAQSEAGGLASSGPNAGRIVGGRQGKLNNEMVD